MKTKQKNITKTFAINVELLKLCMDAAKRDGRSFSSWVRVQLEKGAKS